MRRFSFSAVLLLAGGFCQAQDLAKKVDQLAAEGMRESGVPGLSLAVVKDGRVILQRAYGLANLELNVKTTPNTVFEIGSVTKQFTSALVMMMVEEGKLSLSDPISKYLDNLPEAWRQLTISQALHHTTGIRDYLSLGFNMRKDYSKEELLALVTKAKLEFPPGQSWSYSNSGYYLAGLILEKVSGKTYEELLVERIFKPLGMQDTQVFSPARLIPGRASGYIKFGNEMRNAEVLRPSAAYSAGEIVSTSGDLAKWAAAMLERKMLKESSYAALFEPAKLEGGRTYPYGMGWMLASSNGQPIIHHGGNTYGCSAEVSLFPNQNMAIVVVGNGAGQDFSGLAYEIARLIDKSLIEKPFVQSPDPDKTFTFKMIDALESIMNGRPDKSLLAPEMLGLLNTTRGRPLGLVLRSQLGKLRTLRYGGKRQEGTDTRYFYNGVFEKTTAPLELLVDSEGRLARIE